MNTPRIISEIKVNGVWVNQDDLPEETVRTMVNEVVIRAMGNIGYSLVTPENKKTA